jgi:hypothetical protein
VVSPIFFGWCGSLDAGTCVGKAAHCEIYSEEGSRVKIIVPKDSVVFRRRRVLLRPRRKSVALLATVTILVSLAAAPAPAAGFGGSIATQVSAEDRAVMMEQAPYMDLDERVRQVASAQATSPLAGTRIDRAGRTLYVYWVGVAPPELTAIQKSATQLGITVKVVSAAFSRQALEAASYDLTRIAESTKARLSVTIHNDGSGLTVHQAGLLAAAQERSISTAVQSQVLDAADGIRARSGIPITLADEDSQEPSPQTRTDDRSPHWAGARTATAYRSCTSGFSMYATGNTALRFMMTAAHCSAFKDGVVVGNGVGVQMGLSNFIAQLFDAGPARYDLGVIHLLGSNQGRVYHNETTLDGFYVRGVASGIPAGGNYCVSAVALGYRCNLLSGNQRTLCGLSWVPFSRCITVIDWQSTDGQDVTCDGDSGGPIFYINGPGAIAAGVVSAGYQAPCARSGTMSVVSTAMATIPGLAVVTA